VAIGCAQEYTALIVRQPGDATNMGIMPSALGTIEEITFLEWGRLFSIMSTARIEFTRCPTNCGFMEDLKPWAYELWLYRDGVFAWSGPIVIKRNDRESGKFEITAWDVTGYTQRRTMRDYYTNTDNPTSVAVSLANTFFLGTFDYPDPAFTQYMQVLGLSTSTVTVEYDGDLYTVSSKWAEMVNAGFNYSTFGRYTLMMGETAPNIDNPFVIDATDFLGNMELVEDGTDFAIRVVGTGEGISTFSGAVPTEVEYYGMIDWPPIRYPGITSAVQLGQLTVALLNQKRDLSPELVIPAGSSLASTTEIYSLGYEIQTATPVALPNLLAGMRYDIQVEEEQFCAPGRYPMRLNEMKVTWSPETQEKIAVSLGTLGFPEDE